MKTIKTRIKINIVIMLTAISAIVLTNYANLSNMARLHKDGAKRAIDAVNVKEASMGGMILYHVIADAVIDRDLVKANRDWPQKKAEVLKYFGMVITAADTQEERRQAESILAAIHRTIMLFETELFPALRKPGVTTAEIWELHSRIDDQVNNVESGMDRLLESLEGELKAADEEFNRYFERTISQTLLIGTICILLQGWLAGWLLRKEIDEKIEELAQTKDRVKHLEGLIPICMYCKKIRDDQNSWQQLEKYITEHSEAFFSHGMCPQCFEVQMKDLQEKFPRNGG